MSDNIKTTVVLELTEAEAQAVFKAMLTTYFTDSGTEENRQLLNAVLCAMEDIGFDEVE